jgi:hypothetical protein
VDTYDFEDENTCGFGLAYRKWASMKIKEKLL